jgi:hypothetical protein
MRFLGCGTPPLTKYSLLCWAVLGIRRLVSSPESKPSSSNTGDTMISGVPPRVARWGGLSIRHLSLQRQWRCRHWRHHEGVHGASCGRWQYDVVEMAEQRGCLPLREKAARALHYSTWRIWGEPLPPPAQVCGDQPCAGTGGSCGMEKGWLRISLFCSEDCRLSCEMVKFAQRIGNQ